MKATIQYMIGVFVLFLAGCSSEQDEMINPEQPAEIRFAATGEDFIQTRASEFIGASETGPKFGTFYLLQTLEGDNTNQTWGRYQVSSGEAGRFSPVSEDDKLVWADRNTKYFFRAISVPVGEENAAPGVTFNIDERGEQTGTVRFGDYKGGLEYFVGVTVGPKSLDTNSGQTLKMNFKRQVCKLVVWQITHTNANNIPSYPDKCKITFPNLPATATFDMEHFRKQQGTYPGTLAEGNDYITLDWNMNDMTVEMEWHKQEGINLDKPETMIKPSIYLPPFKFWNGVDNIPENQPGFFIVTLENGNTYTGNLGVNNNKTELYAGEFGRLHIALKDGTTVGGGDGSAIAEWKPVPPTEHPHHRLPGIYSQEDADKLLDALLNNKEIPATFYQEDETTEGKKVIRLFKNIDWSTFSEKITIPDDCVLVGQGFHIKLGNGGLIEGDIEGELYINDTLYKDDKPQEQ